MDDGWKNGELGGTIAYIGESERRRYKYQEQTWFRNNFDFYIVILLFAF